MSDTEGIRVRLGHAVRTSSQRHDGALALALQVAAGAARLDPRPPDDGEAVLAAEKVLAADPRPVYAYLGLLHPELGTVGLIVSIAWAARCLQGASKCDSGGLAGRRGAFSCVEDPPTHLLALSFSGGALIRWQEEFRREIAGSYRHIDEDYVSGTEPDSSNWNDIRAICIAFARQNGLVDRRLWTWETRLIGSPTADEVECLVISPEMRKRLEVLRRRGDVIPDSLWILAGSVEHDGVHWFDTRSVHAAFLGTRST